MGSFEKPRPEPYEPTLILHGGAGAINRKNLPPELYQRYQRSLTQYLVSSKTLLDSGASALDAACHAVSLLEDDPLFNCGRGSVFTTSGEIEMEASVMVASVDPAPSQGAIKRTGAVSRIRNTRHPILLAQKVLLEADDEDGLGSTNTMHCHISGREIEKWGWRKGLERKDDDWFWTQRRWDEHRRGLKDVAGRLDEPPPGEETPLPSQGTVGAVCLDAYGSIAVATSTGGLTNKAPGRVGDTPSVGAGFWAESWEAKRPAHERRGVSFATSLINSQWSWATGPQAFLRDVLADCLPQPRYMRLKSGLPGQRYSSNEKLSETHAPGCQLRTRRVVAMSGTGNGDSFLRVNATRSAAAMCRFSGVSLQEAVTEIAGPGGELQRSAGDRWMKTGEGQGGIIGIEQLGRCACGHVRPAGQVIFDFNCGGMWRALYARDSATGNLLPKVMVFKDEY